MKIICILANLEQARCVKRINSLHNAGFDVIVYGHSRGFYSVHGYCDGISVTDIGKSVNGNGYIRKFVDNLLFIRRLNRSYKGEDVSYYAFAFDIALSLTLITKRSFIYEISDVVYANFKSPFIRKLYIGIDRWLISKSFRTIMTSEGFVKYICDGTKRRYDNIIVQPNKVSRLLNHIDRKTVSQNFHNQLTFGYVGSFRYENTVFRMARIIGESYPQYRFLFYGNSPLTKLAVELSEKYSNIEYRGPFKSPDDLEAIYSTIDVVVACYDNSLINEQIAEPNKLYEAICFCKPLVVSENTYLSVKVQRIQIGYSINASDDGEIIRFLDNLSRGDLEKISEREYSMPSDEYVDSPEAILTAFESLSVG